jgi:hypothetical protein
MGIIIWRPAIAGGVLGNRFAVSRLPRFFVFLQKDKKFKGATCTIGRLARGGASSGSSHRLLLRVSSVRLLSRLLFSLPPTCWSRICEARNDRG